MLRWHAGVGISYEADPRHAQAIVRAAGVESESPAATPGVKATKVESEDDKARDISKKKKAGKLHEQLKIDGEPLVGYEATRFRAVVSRGNDVAADRPDIAFAVKECARQMSGPAVGSWDGVRRLARYLLGKPRLAWWYAYQEAPRTITSHSDSDWAGCVRTRRSTSGGTVCYGQHLLKAWSRTQDTIALSSAEAELYAAVKCSAESIGIQAHYSDSGVTTGVHVFGDASAAVGIVTRYGLGKTRHISTSMLWVP